MRPLARGVLIPGRHPRWVSPQKEAQALEEPAAALGLAVVSMDRAGVGLSDGMGWGMSVRRWAGARGAVGLAGRCDAWCGPTPYHSQELRLPQQLSAPDLAACLLDAAALSIMPLKGAS